MKKVCIIGAGASGLAAIRHVSESQYLDGVVFEQGETIGGLWVYSDEIRNKAGEPVHSTMYKSLRTHLPKQLMQYPDFPFGKTFGSFLTHEEMLKYLNEYTEFHKLKRYINFKHKVINVKPYSDEGNKWLVTVENVTTKTLFIEEYDSVIVCNGHCFKPTQPVLKNEELFRGEILHSRDYRKPDRFLNKKVLVIGGGLSALDLSTEIATFAFEVLLSHKGKPWKDSWLPDNVRQVANVALINEDGIILLEDGNKSQVDSIMYCTGYVYDYPFLSLAECKINVVDGKYVPLYREFIHSKFPSLAFFGLSFLTAAFPLFDCQARFYTKFLEGKVKLPTEAEMNAEIEYDFNLKKNNGFGINKSHSMNDNPWPYFKTLGDEARFQTAWIPLMKSIYNHVLDRRIHFPTLYKSDKITVKSQNQYEYEEVEETLIRQEFRLQS